MQKNLLWKALITGSALFASHAALADAPTGVTIRSVQYSGNGCPEGTVASYITEDAKVFQLGFDQFMAESFAGSLPSDRYKACNILVGLHIPGGWQYSIFKVDYRGYADVDAGLTGTLRSQMSFAAVPGISTLVSNFRGPVSTSYRRVHDVDLESIVWSPCGIDRPLSIKASVALSGDRNRNGLMTVDTATGEFQTLYHLQWQRCRR